MAGEQRNFRFTSQHCASTDESTCIAIFSPEREGINARENTHTPIYTYTGGFHVISG